MPPRSLFRQAWRAVYPPVIYLALSFLVPALILLGCGVFLGVRAGLSAARGPDGLAALDPGQLALDLAVLSERYQLWFTLAAGLVCLPVFLLLRRRDRRAAGRGGDPGFSPLTALLTFGAGAALNYWVGFLISAFGLIRFFPSYEFVTDVLTGGGLLVQVLAIGLAAPLVEELCFRGLLLERLLPWTPRWAAALISSLVFGLVHMNPLQSLYAAAIGMAFAWLYLRFRSLRLCVAGHVAFNLAGILPSAVEAHFAAEVSGWVFLLPSVVIGAVCVWLLFGRPIPREIEAGGTVRNGIVELGRHE